MIAQLHYDLTSHRRAPAETRATASGTRPLALLIPGLDGTGRFYDFQLATLAQRYRTLPWAYPQRPRFDFEDLVRELSVATEGEPPGSMTVVGESFGGTVALNFVLDCPGRVRLLALVNTFCYYDRRVRIALGCRLAPLLRWPGVRSVKDFVGEKVLAAEGIPPEGRRLYRDVVATVDPVAYRRRLELVRETDLRERLEAIKVPTLIFASGRDKVVPSVSSAAIMASRIPGARVFSFPEAGHALLLTPGFNLADYL